MDKNAEITLGAVIKHLNPLVIVDESHNAESDLSIEMLKEINPCFILDLTATPRNNSNIISFVDALELKKANMVKLPVIVYNHQDKTEVINSALQLQKRLELLALTEKNEGGKYIRPIVLFQAQPKNGKDFADAEEEKSNVQKLKEKLIELKIPEEQIKIKTANINEIKNVDLVNKECAVRFIITINALKEGWDCPFAYILASLADKSSPVDVEQILGRVMRQPYVTKHSFPLLNMSYVLTASSKFLDTLDNIVKDLNKAGFSDKDYKLATSTMLEEAKQQDVLQQLNVFPDPETATQGIVAEIDINRITLPTSDVTPSGSITAIEQAAIQQNSLFEKTVSEMENNNTNVIPVEIQKLMKTYSIKDIFKKQAQCLNLPQFFLKIPENTLFGITENELLLDKENLLEGFLLSRGDTNISFDSISTDLYKVDIDETKKDHTPTFVRLDGVVKESLVEYINDPSRKDDKIKNVSDLIMGVIGNMHPIADSEITKFISRVLENFTNAQLNDFFNQKYSYTLKIKRKIEELSEVYTEQKFKDYLDTDKVFIKPSYNLPQNIALNETAKDITKSLYEKECKMNGFEEHAINEIGNMPNIAFWTKNIEKKGFVINGFINHYPDFIIQTKSGKTLLLETKGDHLDAEQKIRLGGLWASKAGNQYRYFMVYERRTVDGAYKLDDFLSIVKDI